MASGEFAVNPKFSIIIPVYNVAPYLRECLDSVLAQMFTDWEAICIDDGSTDGSGAILDEYAKRDKRFRVVHKENGGVSSARNVGMEMAKGEWIAFLDGDDVWAPWALEGVARAIKTNKDADLVRFDTANFYESNQHPWDESGPVNCEAKIEDISREVSAESATCFFGGKIYKRNLLAGIRFETYTVGEDLLFLTQCMMRAKRQVHVQARCYGYRQRMGSASHSGTTERKQRDELGFDLKILVAYDSTEKTVDDNLWRSYANKLTEQFVASQLALPKKVRDELWGEWRDGLKRLLQLKKLPRFQRMRVVALLALPFPLTAYVLCYLPHWLKTKGIHR